MEVHGAPSPGRDCIHSSDLDGRLIMPAATAADASTCTAAPPPASVRLFGVKLTTGCQNMNSHNLGMMRKSVSVGNLGLMGFKPMQRLSDMGTHAHIETAALQPWLESELRNSATHMETQPGYASDGLMQRSSMSSRERRKGVPWTEEEHRLFLAGLQKLGKGDWRGISRNFVTSRTPTQVASHAQKYFLRQSNLNKRKRRSSFFDINAAQRRNAIEEHPQSVAAAELIQPVWELGMRPLIAPSSSGLVHPLSKLQYMPTIPSVSADLCLGRPSCWQGQEPRVVSPGQVSSLDSRQGKQASAILFSSKTVGIEDGKTRTGIDKPVMMVSLSSSSRSMSLSPSTSALCRIDEASELSSLRLSIAPPMSTDVASELALKLEPPMESRQSGIFSPTSKVCKRKDVLLIAGA
ncbi:hypothetical protein L7F22_062406 [Adiantum nelumboides]|nr:hypothetical protein [Adiantum nelumboides]